MKTQTLDPVFAAGARGGRRRRHRAWLVAGVALLLAGTAALLWPQLSGLWYRRAQSGLRERGLAARPLPGQAWGRLEIPKLGLDAIVVEGTTQADLRKGPGHYTETGEPREALVGIAAHRTTWGAPFRHLDRLAPGDEIRLTTHAGTFRYRVSRAPWVVDPKDWSPLREPGRGLVLTSCHPPGSARLRIAVRADLAG